VTGPLIFARSFSLQEKPRICIVSGNAQSVLTQIKHSVPGVTLTKRKARAPPAPTIFE